MKRQRSMLEFTPNNYKIIQEECSQCKEPICPELPQQETQSLKSSLTSTILTNNEQPKYNEEYPSDIAMGLSRTFQSGTFSKVIKVIWHPNRSLFVIPGVVVTRYQNRIPTASTLAPRTIPDWNLKVQPEHLDKPPGHSPKSHRQSHPAAATFISENYY